MQEKRRAVADAAADELRFRGDELRLLADAVEERERVRGGEREGRHLCVLLAFGFLAGQKLEGE